MSNYFKHKFRSKSPGEIAGMIIFGGIFIIGLAILFGFVIMWLWNWLMPEIYYLVAVILETIAKNHRKNLMIITTKNVKLNFLNGNIMTNSGRKKAIKHMKNILNV